MDDPSKGKVGAGAGVGVAGLIALLGWFVVPHEGMELIAYPDPVWGAAVPTACIGETGPHIRMGMNFEAHECWDMLKQRHHKLLTALDRCVVVPVRVHEAIAVLSMADNIGAPKICRSTMVRLLNEGAAPAVWCAQILKWRFAAGKDCAIASNNCRGLITRRKAEHAMCTGQLTLPAEVPDAS